MSFKYCRNEKHSEMTICPFPSIVIIHSFNNNWLSIYYRSGTVPVLAKKKKKKNSSPFLPSQSMHFGCQEGLQIEPLKNQNLSLPEFF